MDGQRGRTVPEAVANKLYAAADLIADLGLANTKIDAIAAASGVPKATLYYYFAGKDEILSFLLRDSLAHLAEEVAAAAETTGSGRDRLAAVITVQIKHTMERPGSSRALVGDLGRAIRLPELATVVQEAFYDPLARVLEAGVADGTLRTLADPRVGAVSIFGAVMMTAMVQNVMPSARAVDEIADGVVDLVVNGLSPTG